MLREAWQEVRLKKREHQEEEEEEEMTSNMKQSTSSQKSLSLNHVQGAFWILLLGALVGTGAFLGELVAAPGRP